MFFKLVQKEIKYQLKSILIYIFLAICIMFYVTQFTAEIAVKKPMNEIEFMYYTLENAYDSGQVFNFETPYILLNNTQKQHVHDAILTLKKYIIENGQETAFNISHDKYLGTMRVLDQKLGGNTVFGDEYRDYFLKYKLNYGSKPITDDNKKMMILFKMMRSDYHSDTIFSYPLGFAKFNKITENRKKAIVNAMNEMVVDGSQYLHSNTAIPDDLTFTCSYQECEQIVEKLNRAMGGATHYSKIMLSNNFKEPKTYEEAMLSFNAIINEDKITNAYARLFSDYLGITAGIFPIFLAAFVMPRDKKYKVDEIIKSKPVSSFTYIFSKYLALVIVTFSCYLLIAAHATISFMDLAKTNNYIIDNLAFFKYTFTWLLPTVMFVIAIGMLLSVIFKKGIVAIPFQLILWFTSMLPLSGDYRLSKYIIRLNSVISNTEYQIWSNQILTNRVFYTIISLVIIIITSLLWSKNRSTNNDFNKKLFSTNKI